jgi:DNA invertase Pin-like site-specific DNA recombinase
MRSLLSSPSWPDIDPSLNSVVTNHLTAQRDRLLDLGVAERRIYLDHGLTGTNRHRPGLDQALAAVRGGDTLVVPKLNRLARSVPDAHAIGDDLAARGIKLSLGGQVYDPTDPMGRMFFNILATFAEFEVDLLRRRTREGMAVARANGRLRGRQLKLSTSKAELRRMHATGDYSVADLAELFTVSRPTVYRTSSAAEDPCRRSYPLVFGGWTWNPFFAGSRIPAGLSIGRRHASTSVVVRTFRTCSERSGQPTRAGSKVRN